MIVCFIVSLIRDIAKWVGESLSTTILSLKPEKDNHVPSMILKKDIQYLSIFFPHTSHLPIIYFDIIAFFGGVMLLKYRYYHAILDGDALKANVCISSGHRIFLFAVPSGFPGFAYIQN